MQAGLLDSAQIDEVRRVGQALGRHDLLASFARRLESSLRRFPEEFATCAARGDKRGALLAAHTVKGSCRTLGVSALADLFDKIEESVIAGCYAEAMRLHGDGAQLIAQSLKLLQNKVNSTSVA